MVIKGKSILFRFYLKQSIIFTFVISILILPVLVFYYNQMKERLLQQIQYRLLDYGKLGVYFFDEENLKTIKNLDEIITQRVKNLDEEQWEEIQKLESGDFYKTITEEEHQKIYFTKEVQNLIQTLRIIKSGSTKNPIYKEKYEQIFWENGNEPFIKWIYIYTPIYKNSQDQISYVKYLADASMEAEDVNGDGKIEGIDEETTLIGTIYVVKEQKGLKEIFQKKTPVCEEDFYEDAWGYWLSCYVPVIDKQYQFYGILGMDMDVTSEHDVLLQVKNISIAIFFGIPLLVFIASLILSKILFKPVENATSLSKKLAEFIIKREFNESEFSEFKKKPQDEFRILYDSLEEIQKYNQILVELTEKNERILSVISRYTPRTALKHVSSIVEHTRSIQFDDIYYDKKFYTFLFFDLVAFTQFAENKEPEKVVQSINHLFNPIISAIHQNEGDIDKFIGDAIFAFYREAVHALDTAMKIDKLFKDKEKNPFEFSFRIGIHSGFAVHGNVGNKDRMEYTLIGDAVNITNRLQSASKINGILLSEDTYNLIDKEKYEFSKKYILKIKGRKEFIKVRYLLNKKY